MDKKQICEDFFKFAECEMTERLKKTDYQKIVDQEKKLTQLYVKAFCNKGETIYGYYSSKTQFDFPTRKQELEDKIKKSIFKKKWQQKLKDFEEYDAYFKSIGSKTAGMLVAEAYKLQDQAAIEFLKENYTNEGAQVIYNEFLENSILVYRPSGFAARVVKHMQVQAEKIKEKNSEQIKTQNLKKVEKFFTELEKRQTELDAQKEKQAKLPPKKQIESVQEEQVEFQEEDQTEL